jgi:putative ABC transport system permease protein
MLRLALADAWADRRLLGCLALTVAAVLAPMLLLLGLKLGLVEHLLGALRDDPQAREITLRGHAPREAAWFDRMRARPDVAFLAPRTRQLSLPVDIAPRGAATRPFEAEFVISGAGDPLLGQLGARIGPGAVVLSERLAREAGVAPGEEIAIWVLRRAGAGNRRMDVTARVIGIAPARATAEAAVFGAAETAIAFEEFREAPDQAGAPPPGPRGFSSFRLYARGIEDVPRLIAELEAEGLPVASDAGRITWTLRLERNLAILFAVLAGSAALGGGIALGASLWGNVERKRRLIALLRVLGAPRRILALLPLVQAALVAALGAALAGALALGCAALLNGAYAEAYLEGGALCLLRPRDLLRAGAVTVALAVLAGAAAVRPVLRVAPGQVLREARI